MDGHFERQATSNIIVQILALTGVLGKFETHLYDQFSNSSITELLAPAALFYFKLWSHLQILWLQQPNQISNAIQGFPEYLTFVHINLTNK